MTSLVIERSDSVAWYNHSIDEIPSDMCELLKGYSRIPLIQSLPHVLDIRSRAFQVCPYPCIGQFKFLSLTLRRHPLYAELLARLKQRETFLDLGCCFGQDLRQLVADGVSSDRLYGLDIERSLIDIGYQLFKDRETLLSTFLVGSIFEPGTTWTQLEGGIDIIHASAFFHLFPWDQQLYACLMLVRLGRPIKGTVVVGRQIGSLVPGEYPGLHDGTTSFRHDMNSLRTLWERVGEMTNTRWKVDGTLDELGLKGKGDSARFSKDKPSWAEPNMRRILFTISRL